MDTCRNVYVQHHEGEDLMKIYFLYYLSPSQTKKLEFLRSKEEKLSSTLVRMKSKIENASFSSTKQKKKSKDATVSDSGTSPVDLKVICCGADLEEDVTNLTAWTLGTQFVINCMHYDIVVNPPVISILKLPKVITCGFLLYPTVCLENASSDDSVFTWYRHLPNIECVDLLLLEKDSNGEHWLKIGESFFYAANDEDVGFRLKVVCLPKLGSRIGTRNEIISTNPVVKGPERYPFQDRQLSTQSLTASRNIRCISYNVLADQFASTDFAKETLFAHCPAEYLDFDYRKQLCIKELTGYNADIICLQEVDRKFFNHDLMPVLTETGLVGIYAEKDGPVTEGISCFFHSTKFRLIHSEKVLLTALISSEPYLKNICDKLHSNRKLLEHFESRNTVLQVVVLEYVDVPQQRIVVGNTHLFYHPDADNIRLIQAYICIKYLEQKVTKYNAEIPDKETSLIFCGDFNSCPDFGVFRLVTGGCVGEECEDWKSNEEEAVDGILLRHALTLSSACGTPLFTNYTESFSGCIDYIFYDSRKFIVKEFVPLPSLEEVTRHTALPNVVFPSDHLALVCTLQMVRDCIKL